MSMILKTICKPMISGAGHIHATTKGARVIAINAANEDSRITFATNSHIPITIKPISQCKPKSMPSAVATPFPPWNLKNTGNK